MNSTRPYLLHALNGTKRNCPPPRRTHDRQALPNRNERQKIAPPDVLRVDFGMMTKIGQALDQIVMNLGARSPPADNELLTGKIAPIKFLLSAEWMIAG
jgi:hypothetical protein